MESLRNCGDDNGVIVACNALLPNPKELYNNYMKIKNDLELVLRELFHSFEIHPFGSSINELAFKGNYDFFFFSFSASRHWYNKPFLSDTSNIFPTIIIY